MLLSTAVSGGVSDATAAWPFWALVANLALLAAYACVWLLLSWYMPHASGKWTTLLPGSVLFSTRCQRASTVHHLLRGAVPEPARERVRCAWLRIHGASDAVRLRRTGGPLGGAERGGCRAAQGHLDRVRRRFGPPYGDATLVNDATAVCSSAATARGWPSGRAPRKESFILRRLEARGFDAKAFQVVLHGGHVVMDDPELYELETCPDKAEPLSSRLGMAGPPVRQSLHGRACSGHLERRRRMGARRRWGPATGWRSSSSWRTRCWLSRRACPSPRHDLPAVPIGVAIDEDHARRGAPDRDHAGGSQVPAYPHRPPLVRDVVPLDALHTVCRSVAHAGLTGR